MAKGGKNILLIFVLVVSIALLAFAIALSVR
jgi:hypothetical protein